MAITHTKVSAKSDDADATLVRPTDWNASHTISDQFLGATGDKNLTPAATSGDGVDTTLAITSTPAAKSYVAVMVNGALQVLGDGVKTKDCYFSATGTSGAAARAIADIIATDELFWNGDIAGFDLATSDSISILYPKT